jgi:hypothetical protein
MNASKLLLLHDTGISYLLRDDFNDTRAAGAVNGTLATPGGTGTIAQRTRTVNDSLGNLALSGGNLVISNHIGGGDPGIWYGAFTRTPGLMFIAGGLNKGNAGNRTIYGFDSDQAGYGVECVLFTSVGQLIGNESGGAYFGTWAIATNYSFVLALRSAGKYYFIKGGTFTNWTLLWVARLLTTATVYPVTECGGVWGAGNDLLSFLRIPQELWLPSPLASDSFNRTDGVLGNTDGAGHFETSGLGSGGNGKAWISQIGTWAIDTNKAKCTVTAGGIGIATVDSGGADVILHINPAVGTSTAGAVLRYVDVDNYLICYHNKTNLTLISRAGGVETTLIDAAAAYNAARYIYVIVYGITCAIYYNDIQIGINQVVPASVATLHGLYSTDTDSKLENLAVWARGTGGEYSALNKYIT